MNYHKHGVDFVKSFVDLKTKETTDERLVGFEFGADFRRNFSLEFVPPDVGSLPMATVCARARVLTTTTTFNRHSLVSM